MLSRGPLPAVAQPFSSGAEDSIPATARPAPTVADTTAPESSILVGEVSVIGNAYTDSARIVRTFEVASGSRYALEAIKRGVRKLFALGLFDDAWVDKLDRGAVVDLVVHVVERPRLARVEFSGNRKRETSELEKKLFLKAGEPYSPVATRTQIDTLLRYYRDEGFARASIDAVTDTTAGPRQVALRFVIAEGERVRVTRIVLEGATVFAAKKLRKQLKTKAKGFFGGGDVKEENFLEDVEKLATYYHDHGHRDARVLGHELQPGSEPRDLTLVFRIEEGPRYQMGEFRWSGNTVLSDAALRRLLQSKPGSPFDLSRIQRAQGQIYSEYAELGYLYLNVEPRDSVTDARVDVQFTIGEGRPSEVRMIHITGNRATREKVIRREIDIHEGDRFRRSALVRSQGDVVRLGFFEDVQIDFAAAESTDVDITLKVKEKSVGTASAGAGYTAESGITGFLELGHTNVLGNGQSLSLHLERGARRSDYYLSFTEPWFRDTPTLLGFSVFNTDRQRDLFDEKRRGGSARIGRPLPWPDYSRGSLTYRLEDVTIKIDKPDSSLTEQDRIVLGGVRSGQAVRTSSLSGSFLRNSANNPFYPTQGSRFSIESEVAGGPFGGAVNFHKHRVEARAYLPSLLKGVTTMVRARIGLLGEYADQHFSVPPYERFRLGGGTTPDPLRGYDDYMVVPDKFVRDVRTGAIAGIDSTSVPGVMDTTFRTQRVRYPGGRFMSLLTLEQQFPIAHPLHGVLFFDAGNTWDLVRETRPFDLKLGAGIGIRLEIPLLGNIGFDYGYGFDRDDGPRFVGHFLIGQTSF